MAEAPEPHPLLQYRAVRYLATIGVAPRWIDLLLLLLTAAMVFLGMILPIIATANVNAPPWVWPAAVVSWVGVAGLFWWSNHFRHRRPFAMGEEPGSIPVAPPTAVPPVAIPPIAVPLAQPVAALRAIPVEPVEPVGPPTVLLPRRRSLAIPVPRSMSEYLPPDA